MKILLLLTFVPSDSLPPLEVLYASIDSFYAVKTQAELAEYQISKKGEWLKYVPTVGLTYTLDGKPRPAISFSSSVIYRAKKDRQLIVGKRRRIVADNRLAAELDKASVRTLYLEYDQALQEWEMKEEIFRIDRQLLEIDRNRYERLEMAPSTFLQAKRLFLTKRQDHSKAKHQLEELKTKMINAARYKD